MKRRTTIQIDFNRSTALKLFYDIKTELEAAGVKFVNFNEFEYDDQSDELTRVQAIFEKYSKQLDKYGSKR